MISEYLAHHDGRKCAKLNMNITYNFSPMFCKALGNKGLFELKNLSPDVRGDRILRTAQEALFASYAALTIFELRATQ